MKYFSKQQCRISFQPSSSLVYLFLHMLCSAHHEFYSIYYITYPALIISNLQSCRAKQPSDFCSVVVPPTCCLPFPNFGNNGTLAGNFPNYALPARTEPRA